ncbi:MAG: HipA domain-containing protein [Flavobacteriaceae bacterium]|nr:HipA domain-containing protein [Flavobacteriaceae bacterium]
MSKCLFCYGPLEKNEDDFHVSCSRKMFSSSKPPILDFDATQVEQMARKVVSRNITITGVQPKLSLQLDKNSQLSRLTIVGVFGDYILKPASPQFPELPQNEDLTMHLAKIVNIKTAKHSLIRLKSGDLAYLTKRFDRGKEGKIAVEDFCQLSENLTEHKYRGSIEKIGKLVHKYTTNTGYEVQRLFELVLFCFLVGNADMHLKNFALIENQWGEFELSPAFDLLNTAIAIPEDHEETALTINGKKRKIKRSDFDTLSNNLIINEKAKQAIYLRFYDVYGQWVQQIEKSFLSHDVKKQYKTFIKEKFSTLYR